ncbi:MAG: isoprenylcysteine carboxylmethyltransferase family protein [Parafilimonas sp.]
MVLQHIILIILWLQFSIFHSFFASEKYKSFMQKFMKEKYKYHRILYSIFAFLNLSVIIIYQFSINNVLLWKVPFIEIVITDTCIIIASFTMVYFAVKFFFYLSGADIFLQTKKTQTLIISNLYKFVRHPLYTATLLLVWSIFFRLPYVSMLISSACITIYTITGIYFEEKKLIKDFGDSYIQYRKKTPMLIPNFSKP